VGDTMHYHPHGDASIYGALVVIANKRFFIEGEGNFGDIRLGTSAAAPRYIDCRLTKLAKETLFNNEITEFVSTYDAKGKEPVRLPAKVPSLLMMGSEGIAVGMATQIFPHNFAELLEAEIAILEDRPFQVFPDFPHNALMDVRNYGDGTGTIRLRARIEADGDKKIIIREIPPSTTVESLVDSIEEATKKGKLKISSINDYSADRVCIEINLQRGIYAEETIKALYAYTACEVTLHSNILVIQDKIPVSMTVSQILHRNVEKLKEYLRRELELQIQKYKEAILFKTLEQLFIEKGVYKILETCETEEKIRSEVMQAMLAFKDRYYREITDDDVAKLLQIPIRRISAFDIARNQKEIRALESNCRSAQRSLKNLTDTAIKYLQELLKKYGADYPRHTEITAFDSIDVKAVARRDIKVFHDKQANFIGTAVKASSKDAEPLVLTEFDKLMLLRGDGTCKVINIPEKEYIGPTKFVFPMNKEQIFRILYRDKQTGTWYAKRFQLGQFILGKEYHVIPPNCLIEQLYTNSGVVASIEISSQHRRSNKVMQIEFDSYPLRSRESRGFKVTSFNITNYKLVNRGVAGEPDTDTPQSETPNETAENKPQDDGGGDGNSSLPQQPEFFFS